jgi:F0F1-type ATP synthase assembly protein I
MFVFNILCLFFDEFAGVAWFGLQLVLLVGVIASRNHVIKIKLQLRGFFSNS